MVGVATKGYESRASTTIPFGAAFFTWLAGSVGGMLIVAPGILTAFGVEGDDYTIPQFVLAAVGQWLVMLAALAYTSNRYGTGRPVDDFVEHFALRFRPVDLVGVPVGVIGQLVIVPLVYVPLRAIWPDTFTEAKLEERAQEIADKAHGGTVVLLFLAIAVAAPLVEELVFRGMLQRSMSTVVGAAAGLVLTSTWFAAIHFAPVEFPGLFIAGLLFGGGLVLTKRIGAGVVTHAAFNATGLWLALR